MSWAVYGLYVADESDQALLRNFVDRGGDEAFTRLVHRHVDLVYFTSFRVVRNPALAEEVTQRVFAALARSVKRLQNRVPLAGWLHVTARNMAINTVRSEERRRLREEDAVAMNHPPDDAPEALWQEFEPVLDDASIPRERVAARSCRRAAECGIRNSGSYGPDDGMGEDSK